MTQTLSLREQMKALESLQSLDVKIDALKKKKAALPAAQKQADDALGKAGLMVEKKKAAIAEIEKQQRQVEAAMDLNRDRLSRANGKFEAVNTTQEFQAANKEMEQLKKLTLTLEEQLKTIKSDLEKSGNELNALTTELGKSQSARDEIAAANGEQSGKLDGEIQALLNERAPFASKVETRVLAQYDRVRAARNGIGFVAATAGRCSGCNMMVPPQLYNELQKFRAVHACPSCHRIISAPVDNTDAAPATAGN